VSPFLPGLGWPGHNQSPINTGVDCNLPTPSRTNTKILGKKELAMEKPLRDQAMKYQVLL